MTRRPPEADEHQGHLWYGFGPNPEKPRRRPRTVFVREYYRRPPGTANA